VAPQDPHEFCDKPKKFECGQHYLWWLKNHDHRTAPPPPPKPVQDSHKNCDRPEKFECGQHYLWWLKNHDHRSSAPKNGSAADAQRAILPSTPGNYDGSGRGEAAVPVGADGRAAVPASPSVQITPNYEVESFTDSTFVPPQATWTYPGTSAVKPRDPTFAFEPSTADWSGTTVATEPCIGLEMPSIPTSATDVAVETGVNGAGYLADTVLDPVGAQDRALNGDYGEVVQGASVIGHTLAGETDKVLAMADASPVYTPCGFGAWVGDWLANTYHDAKDAITGR
jgi:hypothetical protein